MNDRGKDRKPASRARLIAVGIAILAALFGVRFATEEGAKRLSGPSTQNSDEHAGDAAAARAPADQSFAYYVLALSWSPSYCAERPDADQCGRGRRFLLHGLWPNLEDGWDTDCPTDNPRPPRRLLERYTAISGGVGLLGYQWRKHGSCSGLSAEAFFETARRAYESVAQPLELLRLEQDLNVAPDVIEAAFMAANPKLSADGVTVVCRNGRLTEVRVCLTPDLAPRSCGLRARRDCSARSVDLPAPR